jgi:MFS family permease
MSELIERELRVRELDVPRRYPAWRLLTILAALNTVAYLDRSILTLAVPQLKSDLGLSSVEIGVVIGFGFVIFFVLFAIPCGWLVDRMPRRVIVYAGVTLWSIAAGLGGVARSFWQLLSSRVGVGAGESVLNPAAYSLIADAFPRRRLATALTVYGASAGLGGAISVAGGGMLLGYAIAHGPFTLPLLGAVRPWQFVLLIVGLPGAIIAPAIYLVREPPRGDRLLKAAPLSKPSFRELVHFMSERRALLVAILLGFGVLQILSYSFSSWEPAYLVQRFGWNISAVGQALCAGMLLSFVGAFAAGYLVDALIARGVVDAPLRWAGSVALGCGVLIAVAFQLDRAWGCILVVTVAQVPLSLIGVLSTALQQTTPNEFRGRIAGLFLLCGNALGFGFGPLLPALLTDHVFRREDSLGDAVSLVSLSAGILSAIIIWSGCRAMRAAVASATQWQSTEPADPTKLTDQQRDPSSRTITNGITAGT